MTCIAFFLFELELTSFFYDSSNHNEIVNLKKIILRYKDLFFQLSYILILLDGYTR